LCLDLKKLVIITAPGAATVNLTQGKAIDFDVSMGKIENVVTPASTIEISNISIVKTK